MGQDISNRAILDCTNDEVEGGVEDLSNLQDDEEQDEGSTTTHVSDTEEEDVNYDVSSPESQWNDSDASSDEQRRCTFQHRDLERHPRSRSPF